MPTNYILYINKKGVDCVQSTPSKQKNKKHYINNDNITLCVNE